MSLITSTFRVLSFLFTLNAVSNSAWWSLYISFRTFPMKRTHHQGAHSKCVQFVLLTWICVLNPPTKPQLPVLFCRCRWIGRGWVIWTSSCWRKRELKKARPGNSRRRVLMPFWMEYVHVLGLSSLERLPRYASARGRTDSNPVLPTVTARTVA